MPSRISPAVRMALGAIGGALLWPLLGAAISILPLPIRFIVPWFLFTIGPGAAVAGWLTRDLDWVRRAIVLLGTGSAATAVLGDVLGRAGFITAYPYVAAVLLGIGIATWPSRGNARAERGDVAACLGLMTLALGLGAVVFWHRLHT